MVRFGPVPVRAKMKPEPNRTSCTGTRTEPNRTGSELVTNRFRKLVKLVDYLQELKLNRIQFRHSMDASMLSSDKQTLLDVINWPLVEKVLSDATDVA